MPLSSTKKCLNHPSSLSRCRTTVNWKDRNNKDVTHYNKHEKNVRVLKTRAEGLSFWSPNGPPLNILGSLSNSLLTTNDVVVCAPVSNKNCPGNLSHMYELFRAFQDIFFLQWLSRFCSCWLNADQNDPTLYLKLAQCDSSAEDCC